MAIRPDDIPADIWEAALQSGRGGDGETIACARAILAERRRCAVVAYPPSRIHRFDLRLRRSIHDAIIAGAF